MIQSYKGGEHTKHLGETLKRVCSKCLIKMEIRNSKELEERLSELPDILCVKPADAKRTLNRYQPVLEYIQTKTGRRLEETPQQAVVVQIVFPYSQLSSLNRVKIDDLRMHLIRQAEEAEQTTGLVSRILKLVPGYSSLR